MDLNNTFEVTADRAAAWAALNDVERIAPCLPGAQLQEIEGDEFRGIVKVKVGPITAQYKGKAVFVERDETAGRVVLQADGRDTRGAGNANAKITAAIHELDPARTRVDVHTDLAVTGKVAQFGRGVMADVSEKLMDQFAANLQELLDSAPDPVSADVAAPVDADGVRRIDAPDVEAVDLLDAAGTPVFKRLVPVAGAIVVALGLRHLFRSRRR